MIVTKTPLRVSFFGGGPDLPEFFEYESGKVLSTTINVFMHIVINETPHKRVKACYDQIELTDTSEQIKHERIRETLLEYNVFNNIEVSSFCHIPTRGTGLGSSSSFTVGLCAALEKRNGLDFTPGSIAERAYKIERVRCSDSLGKQDQYAAAFGGLNLFTFKRNQTLVQPVVLDTAVLNNLENSLMFFYTGIRRNANEILSSQAKSTKNGANVNYLKELAMCAELGTSYLHNNSLFKFGSLLNYAWNLKKQVDKNISNEEIDGYYNLGIKSGALGGKLLGAGGGGYLMFFVNPEDQDKVRKAMPLQEYKFKFSNSGTEVVYEHITSY